MEPAPNLDQKRDYNVQRHDTPLDKNQRTSTGERVSDYADASRFKFSSSDVPAKRTKVKNVDYLPSVEEANTVTSLRKTKVSFQNAVRQAIGTGPKEIQTEGSPIELERSDRVNIGGFKIPFNPKTKKYQTYSTHLQLASTAPEASTEPELENTSYDFQKHDHQDIFKFQEKPNIQDLNFAIHVCSEEIKLLPEERDKEKIINSLISLKTNINLFDQEIKNKWFPERISYYFQKKFGISSVGKAADVYQALMYDLNMLNDQQKSRVKSCVQYFVKDRGFKADPSIKYTGWIMDMMPQGPGRKALANGDYLEGSFEAGALHGKGKSKKGNVYSEGDFVKDLLVKGKQVVAGNQFIDIGQYSLHEIKQEISNILIPLKHVIENSSSVDKLSIEDIFAQLNALKEFYKVDNQGFTRKDLSQLVTEFEKSIKNWCRLNKQNNLLNLKSIVSLFEYSVKNLRTRNEIQLLRFLNLLITHSKNELSLKDPIGKGKATFEGILTKIEALSNSEDKEIAPIAKQVFDALKEGSKEILPPKLAQARLEALTMKVREEIAKSDIK